MVSRDELVDAVGLGVELGRFAVARAGECCARAGGPLGGVPVRGRDGGLAAASIPVVFPPIAIGGEHYVDGGVREILPLALAFNGLGAGHIFAVVASAAVAVGAMGGGADAGHGFLSGTRAAAPKLPGTVVNVSLANMGGSMMGSQGNTMMGAAPCV